MGKMLGFSLIELMACVAIMALITSASLPAFNQWQNKQDFAALISQVIGAIHRAKAFSIQRHQDYWVGWNTSCFWLASVPTNSCTQQVVELPEWSRISGNFSSGNVVQFSQGRGMAGFSSGTLTLGHSALPQLEVRIVVSSLGRIRLCQTESLFSAMDMC